MNRPRARRSFALPLLAAVLSLCVLAPSAHAAAARARDAVFEQQIVRELQAVAPDAVPLFQRATAAGDAQDFASAVDLFSKVLDLAPGFTHAERRKCGALAQLGRRDEALPLCRSALARDESPPNEAALAGALLSTKDAVPPFDAAEAKRLAAHAADSKPDDPYYWNVLVQASLADNDLPSARSAVDRLEHLSPDDPTTNYEAAIVAGQGGDLDGAETALARARAHGLPEEQAARFAKALDAAQAGPWWLRAVKGLGRALLVWLVVLGLLLGAGYALSRATLRAVAERPTEATVRPSERRLRKAYRAILWVACAYYYASLPLLAIVVVAATAGGIFAVLAAGFIAPKLFIILVIIAFGSLAAIAKSIFVRVRDEEPGLALDLAANPKMRATLDEVAARIGTRPVDRVFVTPFTEVAVFDRGSLGAQLRGASDRCLILGAGVLDGMRLRAFKSVLAHEYGHFHNEDTAGGGFALAVRRSLLAMTKQLVVRRAASALNPAWWFVRGFWRAFLGISQGASRLQEVLADRWAAFAYGSLAFEEGLRHVVERSVRFDAHLGATLDEVVKTKSALPNLYAFAPVAPATQEAVDAEIAKALGKKPTPFDSHPCPEDRLTWIRALASDGVGEGGVEDGDAWSLFADRAAIEAMMTSEVRTRLKTRHGVTVPAA
jgi:Zn-dependent protease with chaperone function/Flp pilus assembly protein TadD